MWNVGLNMPGYMPDSEPHEYESWQDAKEGLLWELERSIEDLDETDDASELEDALERVRKLSPDSDYGETIGVYHYWLTRS